MPEGDALARTAAGLRPYLLGRSVTAARAQLPGPQVHRIVGAQITGIDSVGKNLLIRFDNGLELRTHLRMNGAWHRYRPNEPWRRPPARARLVLEVPGAVAVCFDAPTIELFEQRAERLHPSLSRLGPDLLAPEFDTDEALRRLRAPSRGTVAVAEALSDQTAVAGIGNIWKSETLFAERVNPFAPVAELDDETLLRLVATARRKLQAGVAGRTEPTQVYRRAGRPCPRCGTLIRSGQQGAELPRTTYWCPTCQGGERMTTIDVSTERSSSGWRCAVRVIDEQSSSEHVVQVAPDDLDRLDPGATDPTDLVRRSFAFMLAREPKESILRSFDLPVIGRYFPEYERDIRGRV